MAEEEPRGGEAQHLRPEHPAKMAHFDEKMLHKDGASPPPKYRGRRAVSTFIVILLVLAGITALTLWLVYRPHEPKFRVVSAAVYELNASAPPFLSTTMQFTVVIRNPNRRASIYYDRLSAYVSYKNQAITPPAMLPPLFQETKTTVGLSPLLGGGAMPVVAEVMNALVMEENYGVVRLRLVVTGKVRYKAAGVKSGRYGLHVRCDLLVGLKRGFVGQLPFLGSPPCIVDA